MIMSLTTSRSSYSKLLSLKYILSITLMFLFFKTQKNCPCSSLIEICLWRTRGNLIRIFRRFLRFAFGITKEARISKYYVELQWYIPPSVVGIPWGFPITGMQNPTLVVYTTGPKVQIHWPQSSQVFPINYNTSSCLYFLFYINLGQHNKVFVQKTVQKTMGSASKNSIITKKLPISYILWFKEIYLSLNPR